MAVVCRRQGRSRGTGIAECRRSSARQGDLVQSAGAGAERSWCRKHGRVQQSAGWGRVQARCTQAAGDLQQGVGRSAAGRRLQWSKAQARVQQGAGSGAAGRGLSKAQAQVQQGASMGAAGHRDRCSKQGGARGPVRGEQREKGGFQTPFSFFFFG
ncbi:hypothetical protein SLEP1_g16639 [Rubroshorea leprosula]|uniref:Uncharacterized protein n=1 Tax=Rubroshorea leprosula TaxID=152421 RepID=A0AAV5J1Z9_9ROSI|nr:hypothetical protein SLEP1_g16639 [Rubroshorea leprosula]